MSSKLKTISLILVVFFLLVSTIYVSFILKNESESTPKLVTKKKGTEQTYIKTLILNNTPTPTIVSVEASPSATITPVGSISADKNSTAGSSIKSSSLSALLSPLLSATPTPETSAVAIGTRASDSSMSSAVTGSVTPTPTEVLLASTSATPAASPTVTLVVTKASTLPETGWVHPAQMLFMLAFLLIIFSLLY